MIFYFSGTGNSLYAATKLAQITDDSVVSIGDALKSGRFDYRLADNERVGFVFPVYYWGLPTVIEEFISKLTLENYNKNFTYSIITCGANIGNAMKVLKAGLAARNYSLDSGFSLAMPDNYIFMYNVPSKEAQKTKLDAADKHLDKLAQYVLQKQVGVFRVERGAAPAIMTKGVHLFYKYGRKTKKFHTTAQCTGCGLCSKICPTGTIHMENKKPVWGTECTQCLGCINRCPAKAIQYGKSTYNRGRYINPNAYSSNKA